MSQHSQLIVATALPHLMGHHGDAASYQPAAGGAAVSLTCMAGPISTGIEGRGNASHWPTREITVATDPSGEFKGVSAPREGDTVTIGGVVWTVDGIAAQDGGLARLYCLAGATARMLRQTATYWAPSGSSGYGGPGFASPVSLACRWEDRQELFRERTGREVVSQSIVFLAGDVQVGGWLYLGTSAGADPHAVSGAHEIRSFGKTPAVGATLFIRRAVL